MVAIKGHFDGKVIVPDEPVNLAPNQRLLVHLQPLPDHTPDFRSWIGMGMTVPENQEPRFTSDDELWG